MIRVEVNRVAPLDVEIKSSAIKGDKGDPFKFEDFTEEQLANLKGPKGDAGDTPVKGVDYFDGKDGYTPVKGVDYFDGKDGYSPVKGIDYFDGKDGEDGKTPVKGVDYRDGIDGKDYVLTDADKTEIANMVEVPTDDHINELIDAKVAKASSTYGTSRSSSGYLNATTKTYEQYQSSANTTFIGKGTLENVLNERLGAIEDGTY